MKPIRRAALAIVATLALATTILAGAGKPNFGPVIYGEGKLWGTKVTGPLAGPNENNIQSFDRFFIVTNGAPGQLPVSDSAPGSGGYNGGRWITWTAMWTQAGSMHYAGDLPVLMSFADIDYNADMGFLTIFQGSPAGGPPPYFLCPLLPVK